MAPFQDGTTNENLNLRKCANKWVTTATLIRGTKSTSKIWISNVPPEADIEKSVAAVPYRQREEITIIDADVTEESFLTGIQVIITVQADMETPESIPE